MIAQRPAAVCRALLCAIEAAEGRRRSRKRDQTPDAIGLAVKRRLLARIVESDPDPAEFEGWLVAHAMPSAAGRDEDDRRHRQEGPCPDPGTAHAHAEDDDPGALAAMARAVLDEWRMAHNLPAFAEWLEEGAPSEDSLPRR